MAKTSPRVPLSPPKFKAGESVTMWVGWSPHRRSVVAKANKRGIWLVNGEVFTSRGDALQGMRYGTLKPADRRAEAEARLSEITNSAFENAMRNAGYWKRFTLEQLEAALYALCLSFE